MADHEATRTDQVVPVTSAHAGRGDGERVTEIGRWERVDRRRHPLALAVALTALVAVIVVGLVGLGVAVREGDRRVEVPDVLVPSVEGLTQAAARDTLDDLGLLMEVSEAPNELVEAGVVFDQEPINGARVEKGAAVTVGVSTGPAGAIVPDIVGQQIAEAQGVLAASGLHAVIQETHDESVRVGEVLRTEPAAGRRADGDGEVKVMVSNGPAPRTVPEVVGGDVLEVLARLGRLRLRPEKVSRVEDTDAPEGTVLSIEPEAGSAVPRDSDVRLTVAGVPSPVTMPAVSGLLRSTAVRVLEGSGIDERFRVVALPAGDPLDGRVVRQGVTAGSQVPRGTTVEILIGSAPSPPTTTTTTTTPTSTLAPTTTTEP